MNSAFHQNGPVEVKMVEKGQKKDPRAGGARGKIKLGDSPHPYRYYETFVVRWLSAMAEPPPRLGYGQGRQDASHTLAARLICASFIIHPAIKTRASQELCCFRHR
jgi:hypothetical protein